MCNPKQCRTRRFLPLLLLLTVFLTLVVAAPPAMAVGKDATQAPVLSDGSNGVHGTPTGGGGKDPNVDGDPDDYDLPWQPLFIDTLAKLYVFLGR